MRNKVVYTKYILIYGYYGLGEGGGEYVGVCVVY